MLKTSLETPINLGNPSEFSIRELATLILKLTDSSSKVINHELPLDDPLQRRPDVSKAIELIGWSPKIDTLEGLKKTIAYFREIQ
jgi:UDP-glucuronate decarboxylase